MTRLRQLLPGPRAAVLLIVAGLLTSTILLWATGTVDPRSGIDGADPGPGGGAGSAATTTGHLWWWVLAGLFAVTECAVLHVQVRREGESISLSEIPLVLGLFLLGPGRTLAAAVAGCGFAYVVLLRQSPIKSLFNTTLRAAAISLALLALQTLAPNAVVTDPQTWTATLLALVAATQFEGLMVLVVVALHEGVIGIRTLGRELVTGAVLPPVIGCLGLVTIVTLDASTWAGGLLLVAGAAVLAGFKAHATLVDRHHSLTRLFDYSQDVIGPRRIEEIVTRVLAGTRELLRAEAAELVLIDPNRGAARRYLLPRDSDTVEQSVIATLPHAAVWDMVIDQGVPLLAERGRRGRPHAERLQALGYREGIIAPLFDDSGLIGTLLVADRMGEVRAFGRDDVPILRTAANHAGLVIRGGHLVERLRQEALHDALTGLANRTMFRASLQDRLAQLNQSASPGDAADGESAGGPGLAVLLLDLDGFKEVNDSLGHHAGDTLLVHVASCLTRTTGPTATVARLGGDEFAVLLPHTDNETAALTTTRRIEDALAEPIDIEGVPVQVRASIGVTLAPEHGADPTVLLRRADQAMYEAKGDGGGTRVFRDTAAPASTGSSAGSTAECPLELLAQLRHAITDGQITIHLQPQTRPSTGDVLGAEALARWNHPTRGTMSPAEFLPLAERHGLMPALTELVIDQAMACSAEWRDHGLDLTVSVNIPADLLTAPATLAAITSSLARHAVPASSLTLEITENALVKDPARATETLTALRRLGARLSIDDFGTGYSSLSYLRLLPVDEIKIDRSFISTLADDTYNQIIATSIVDLAHSLHLTVVAEGIEDSNSLNHLAQIGADCAQGYHIARPMPAPDFLTWMLARTTKATPRRTPPAELGCRPDRVKEILPGAEDAARTAAEPLAPRRNTNALPSPIAASGAGGAPQHPTPSEPDARMTGDITTWPLQEPDSDRHTAPLRSTQSPTPPAEGSPERPGTPARPFPPRSMLALYAVLALAAVGTAGYGLLPLRGTPGQIWYDAVAVMAIGVAAAGLVQHRPTHRAGWVLILLGFAGWVVGDLVWSLEQQVLSNQYPAPSDGFYLASYLTLGSGTLRLTRARRAVDHHTAAIDAAIVTTGAATVLGAFVIIPITDDSQLSLAARLVGAAYPLGDLFLLAVLARILTRPHARGNISIRLLLLALGATAAADTAWNTLLVLTSSPASSHWLDTTWLVGYVLVAAATCVPSMCAAAEPAPADRRHVQSWTVPALLGGTLTLPAIVVLVDTLRHVTPPWALVGAASLTLTGLVVTRFALIQRLLIGQATALQTMSLSDPLTGAIHRQAWDSELHRACSSGLQGPLCVAVLDLDHFHAFNQRNGTKSADRLLREAVAAWSRVLPDDAQLSRYGADEFTLLLPRTCVEDALDLLRRLRAATPHHQTFSAGLAQHDAVSDADTLMAAAQRSLHQSKVDGRNTITLADTRVSPRTQDANRDAVPLGDGLGKPPVEQECSRGPSLAPLSSSRSFGLDDKVSS